MRGCYAILNKLHFINSAQKVGIVSAIWSSQLRVQMGTNPTATSTPIVDHDCTDSRHGPPLHQVGHVGSIGKVDHVDWDGPVLEKIIIRILNSNKCRTLFIHA